MYVYIYIYMYIIITIHYAYIYIHINIFMCIYVYHMYTYMRLLSDIEIFAIYVPIVEIELWTSTGGLASAALCFVRPQAWQPVALVAQQWMNFGQWPRCESCYAFEHSRQMPQSHPPIKAKIGHVAVAVAFCWRFFSPWNLVRAPQNRTNLSRNSCGTLLLLCPSASLCFMDT